jgi:hypothetical protein
MAEEGKFHSEYPSNLRGMKLVDWEAVTTKEGRLSQVAEQQH